jgi:predicted Zn-dependent protease
MEGLVNASGKSIPVKIKVFDDDSTMNAFAMSGNQIFVFSGLIKKSQDYEELAGVLAHELGHVLKRHPTEGVIHALGLTLIIKLISGGLGQLDYVLNASNVYLTLHYSRAHETEADDIAIDILTKTGVGTKGFLTFFNKLQAEEEEKLGRFHGASRKIEGFLSTHPLTEDRINRIKEKSFERSLPNKRIITKTEWAQIKAMCSAVPGDKEREKKENP